MAADDVEKKFTFHSPHGDVACWVTEYQAGKDAGDHHIAGFSNSKMKAAGEGDTFSRWAQFGPDESQFN
jgi:hypothetical protein